MLRNPLGRFLATLPLTLVVLLAAGTVPAQSPAAKPAGDWVLVWADEFDQPDGSAPDPAKWSIVTGGEGFGNDELETYTTRPENLRIEHGNLVITARREEYTGTDLISRSYTSARLETKGHFEQQYGRVEARIQIPENGPGVWPAFWMMGSDVDRVGWPECGEVDIMENIGTEPDQVHGTLHGPGYSGDAPLTGTYRMPQGRPAGRDYHVYGAEWEPGKITFTIDGKPYETWSAANIPGKRWAFDHPFYLLLDLAVGGNWPGPPRASTRFPARMLVDWVRVYSQAAPADAATPAKP